MWAQWVTLWHWHVAWPASLWLLIFHLNVWSGGRLLSSFGSPLSATYSLWRDLRSLSPCPSVNFKIGQWLQRPLGNTDLRTKKLCDFMCFISFASYESKHFQICFSLNYLSSKRWAPAATELYDIQHKFFEYVNKSSQMSHQLIVVASWAKAVQD